MNVYERERANHIVCEAWRGLWASCMAGVGGTSPLTWDADLVGGALNGKAPAEQLNGHAPVAPRIKSALATQLEGDRRISAITLADVLLGLDDYFRIFRQMKRSNPEAYDYFRRVGAPLCFESLSVPTTLIDHPPPITNANDLPGYFGVFLTKSKERARDSLLNDAPSFLDFQLYEKRRRNVAVASPWKYIIYDHTEFHLDRDVLTRTERRKMPWAGRFAFHYYIGIAPDGIVKALPMQMSDYQRLRNGGEVHHSRFVVPPALADMCGTMTVDQFVALWFTMIRGFCDAALSGVQLSVRKGNETARFGIPLTAVKSFFRDRDRKGARRSALLHFVGEYSYERGGRPVTVGEHLRGARRFTWRDYSITISAPGIHVPAPEALGAATLHDDDILPIPRDAVPIGEWGKTVQGIIQQAPPVPFRRGKPTATYRKASLQVDLTKPPEEADMLTVR
jgi:hypothetical protein